jgi:hypothetical protein
MNDAFQLMYWVLSIAMFVAYGTIGLQHYQKTLKQKFSWQQQLPFELHDLLMRPGSRYQMARWFLIIGAISLFAYWDTVFVKDAFPVSYIFLIFGSLWLFSFLSLFFFNPLKIEVYILVVALFLMSTTAVLFLGSYLVFLFPFQEWQTFLPWTTLAQAVIQLGLLLNPKLKSWTQLEKISSENLNEKPLYRRPQHFVMAYTQWLSMANMLLWLILIQLESLIG